MNALAVELSFSRSRTGEQYQFYEDVLKALSAEIAALLKIETLRGKYAAAFAAEDLAYMKSQAYPETVEIVAKDAERDHLYAFIKQSIATNLISPVTATVKHARALATVMKPYRNAITKSFVENSAEVTNFCQDASAEAVTPHVAALGLTDALELLRTTNEDFKNIYSARSEVKEARLATKALIILRPKTDNAFVKIARTLNALALVTETVTHDAETIAVLSPVMDAIAGTILQFRQNVKRHVGRNTSPSIKTQE